MNMDESLNFDPNTIQEAESSAAAAAFLMGHHQEYAAMELQQQQQQQQQLQQLALGYDNNNSNNWQQYNPHYHNEQQQQVVEQQEQVLNLFHFAGVDPLLHLNLPAPHPPSLFHYSPSVVDSLYVDPALHFDSAAGGVVLEFGGGRDRRGDRGGVGGGGATATKHFASERHRRDQMRDTYSMLRSLVPNPTKNDRASVVGDAIEYIKELRRSVSELKMLVERKRRGRDGMMISKRHKPEDHHDHDNGVNDGNGDNEGVEIRSGVKADPEHYNPQIRSSWLQRKSKDTEVDVRIVDDEVTVKLVQRKKINLLLAASKVLDELQLDLRHVAGGHVGDTYSYLFNTKIYEGSSLYASAIANKLIDVLDRQYASMTY